MPSRCRDERAGWPIVEVVDRAPRGAVEALAGDVAADPPRCATPDRRWSACTTRRAGPDCWPAAPAGRCSVASVCEAAVVLDDDGSLVCGRCGTTRPAVCQACGAGAFANLRPGVSRLREEIEAAAGRPVVVVTGRERRVACPTSRRLRRHRGGAAPRRDAPTWWRSSTSTPSCSRRDTEPASRRWRLLARAARLVGAASARRAVAGADVPAASRGAAGRLAGRPGAARQRRARAAGELLGLPPFARAAPRSAGRAATRSSPAARRATASSSAGRRRSLLRARDWDSSARRSRRPPAPEGLAPARRGRPAPDSACLHPSVHGRSELPGTRDIRCWHSRVRSGRSGDAGCGSRSATQPLGGIALLGEPALQRVGAEVLVHDQARRARRGQAREPASAAARAAPACRSGSAGWTRCVEPHVGGHVVGRRRATLSTPLRAAFAGAQVAARSLTSTAHTCSRRRAAGPA